MQEMKKILPVPDNKSHDNSFLNLQFPQSFPWKFKK